jgi:hypothetical protein
MPAGKDLDTPAAAEWLLGPGVISGLKGSRRPAAADRMLAMVVRGDSAPAGLATTLLEDVPEAGTGVSLGMPLGNTGGVWVLTLLVERGDSAPGALAGAFLEDLPEPRIGV